MCDVIVRWEVNSGNQPGAIQQPPSLYLDATIILKAATGRFGKNSNSVRVVSDGMWSSAAGATTYNSVYQGERNDLRLSRPGWSGGPPGFQASSDWQPVVVSGGTDKQLTEQTRPAVVELMALRPLWVKVINVDDPSRHHSIDHSCGVVEEDVSLMVSCPNSTINTVLFAQYGTPAGDCSAGSGHLKPGKCARDLSRALETACVGKVSCTVECRSCGGSNNRMEHNLGKSSGLSPPPCLNSCSVNGKMIVPSGDPCEGTKKTLVVAVSCDATPPPPPPRKPQHAHLVDFGQNIGGVVRLKPPSNPTDAQTITIRHCEVRTSPLALITSLCAFYHLARL